MGRHSAADGASVDPVVAAALARRSAGAPAHRYDDEHAAETGTATDGAERGGDRDTARMAMGPMTAEQSGGAVGWPAPPEREPSPGGLGWPGGMPDPARQSAGEPAADTPAEPAGPSRPRGWRRIFRAA